MAYVDLVSSGVTLVSDTATTYNFAYDSPVSADGSPHITMLGIQLDLTMTGGAPTLTGTASQLIDSLRIKVGSNEIINYDNPAIDNDGAFIGNLGVIAQTVGGVDTTVVYDTDKVLAELSLPFGLDATRSHRINVQIKLAKATSWNDKAITASSSEMNVIHYYGTSTEATLYGSRQDFTLTSGSTRTITVYGKQGWNMLGVFAMNETANTDSISKVRVNNGAFRELKIQQWRNINGNSWRSPLRYLNTGGADVASPNWVTGQKGNLFIDLMRLTAGAPIDMSVTATANKTYSFAPVWVAPIGKGTGQAPKQTKSVKQNTTEFVVTE